MHSTPGQDTAWTTRQQRGHSAEKPSPTRLSAEAVELRPVTGQKPPWAAVQASLQKHNPSKWGQALRARPQRLVPFWQGVELLYRNK